MYVELTSYNLTKGPQILLCYTNDITNSLMISLLLVVFFAVITIASYQIPLRTTGRSDFWVSFATASTSTLVLVFMLILIECPYNSLINFLQITISIGIFIISLVALYLSQDR